MNRPRGVRLAVDHCFRKAIHAVQSWGGFTTSPLEWVFSGAGSLLGSHRESLDDIAKGIRVRIKPTCTIHNLWVSLVSLIPSHCGLCPLIALIGLTDLLGPIGPVGRFCFCRVGKLATTFALGHVLEASGDSWV